MTGFRLPWYDTIERTIAPTEPLVRFWLVVLAVVCLYLALKGDKVLAAGFLIYLISP